MQKNKLENKINYKANIFLRNLSFRLSTNGSFLVQNSLQQACNKACKSFVTACGSYTLLRFCNTYNNGGEVKSPLTFKSRAM